MHFEINRAIAFGFAIVALSTGCLDLSTSGAKRSSQYTGDVGVQLQVGNGTIKKLRYSMANATSSYQGLLEIADASSVLAVIGGIQAGPGYVLALSGSTTDGRPCEGISSHFDVAAYDTTVVGIDVRCRTLGSVGSGLSDCPCAPPAEFFLPATRRLNVTAPAGRGEDNR